MTTLDKKTVDRLGKMFTEVYEGNRSKLQISKLDQTLYQIQQTWTSTN